MISISFRDWYYIACTRDSTWVFLEHWLNCRCTWEITQESSQYHRVQDLGIIGVLDTISGYLLSVWDNSQMILEYWSQNTGLSRVTLLARVCADERTRQGIIGWPGFSSEVYHQWGEWLMILEAIRAKWPARVLVRHGLLRARVRDRLYLRCARWGNRIARIQWTFYSLRAPTGGALVTLLPFFFLSSESTDNIHVPNITGSRVYTE